MAQTGADTYERFFHTIATMVAVTGPDGRVVEVNPGWEAGLGYTAAETSGRPYLDFIHPDDHGLVKAHAVKAAGGERPTFFEARLLCRDCSEKWTAMSIAPDSGNRLFYCANAEVSPRTRMENALLEKDATLRKIVDSAPMAMAIVNIDGTIEYINRKAVEVFGYPHSDIPTMERWWVQAYPDPVYRKEVVETWMSRVYKAYETGSEIPGSEFRVTRKDGGLITCHIFGVIAAGKVFVMFDDISRRVAEENALRESAETLHRIIEQAPAAMSISSRGGRLEFVNRRFTEIFGYSQHDISDLEALGRQAYPDEEYRREVIAYWGEVAASARSGTEMPPREFRIRCKDGSFKTVISSSVITPEDKIVTLNEDITAKLQAEQAVKDSERMLRQILDQAPIAIAIQNFDNRIEFLNRKFQEYFGYTAEDAPDLGRWAQLAYPDEAYRNRLLAFQKEQIEKSLRTGREMDEIEVKVACKDGSRKIVRVTGVVTPDKKIVSLLEDVTQRSETQKALSERESLYRALVETTRTGYVIMDGRGQVLDANREYVRLTGHSDLKEIMGRNVVEWSAQNSRKRAVEAVEIVARDGRLANFELDYVDKTGKLTTIEINATAVSRGGARQILALCRDVSARSKTEAQLRDSESLYRALVETTRTGYVVIDNTGKVIDANREYVRLTGHSDLKEILGRAVTEWTAPDLAEKNAAAVAQCARDGHIFNFETDYIDKAGRRTPIEINATVVSRGSGPQIHTLCRDISQRRKIDEELRSLNQGLEARVRERTAALSAANEDLMAEIAQRVQAEKEKTKLGEELQQAQKMEAVGRLAGGIAHDFNNILVSISGYAEFLLKVLPEEAQGREDLAEILLETEKGASLTRQLLTFSRKQPIETKLLDLNAVVSETEKMLKRLIGTNIRFEKSLAPGLDRITADPSQVSQVILNLVLNARDAMPEGGRITLETRNVEIGADHIEMRLTPKPGHYVQLRVSDTGCGMSAAALQHIFEPFFTTKEEGKGTGLGLPTVYGIVSQARGGIAVKTEPGKGSSFSVYFPRTVV